MFIRGKYVIFIVLLLLFGQCYGDILTLENGKELEGSIVEQNSEKIYFKTVGGTITLPASMVKSITEESESEEIFRFGKKQLEKGDKEKAIKTFRKVLELDPNHTEASYYVEEHENEIEFRKFKKKLDPIKSYVEKNKFREAIDQYKTLLDDIVNPKHLILAENDLANAYAKYAFYLYDHLRADLALEQIQEARKLVGDFAELHFILGRIAEQDYHYSDAIWEYEETIRLDQNHIRAKEALFRLKTMHPSLFEPISTEPSPIVIPPRLPKPAIPTQIPFEPKPEPESKPFQHPRDVYAAIDYFAEKNNFDPNFIETIIKIESGFNPNAVSEADCRGLMQLGKGAWGDCTKRLGLNWDFDEDAYDPIKNIRIGCEYLRWMRDEYFSRYQKELLGIPIEIQLIQGYHSGPWRTVVYEGKVPGPRMARYRELYALYRSMGQ